MLGAGAAIAMWTYAAYDNGVRITCTSELPSDFGGNMLLVGVDDSTVGEAGEGDVDGSGCNGVSVEDASDEDMAVVADTEALRTSGSGVSTSMSTSPAPTPAHVWHPDQWGGPARVDSIRGLGCQACSFANSSPSSSGLWLLTVVARASASRGCEVAGSRNSVVAVGVVAASGGDCDVVGGGNLVVGERWQQAGEVVTLKATPPTLISLNPQLFTTMTNFPQPSSGTASVPVAAFAFPPSTDPAAIADFQNMWATMTMLSQGQVPAPVPAPALMAPVQTAAPPVPTTVPVVQSPAPAAPVRFRTRSSWVVGALYIVVPTAPLMPIVEDEHIDEDTSPWYAIMRGLYVGITLSNALAINAVVGIRSSHMKSYATQAFNDLLANNMVAVITQH
ncbi:hypothetical protein B0H13DRAFT_1879974 [Mycena leptocephala]|nr:hypothetical protein B0H13DRAFT_1879974 [Mycena leptocephala]